MKNRKFWQGFLTGGLSVLLCMLLVCAGLTVTGKIDIRNMIMKVSSGSILNKKLDSKMTELQAYIDQFFLDDIDREKVTLVVLYQRWSEIKLPRLGKSNQQSLRAAFKHCSKYYGVKYRSMKSYQMQDCIDNCGCAYSTQWAIKNLFGHLDRFAFEIDLIDKMYSQITTAPPIPETTREPFTQVISSPRSVCKDITAYFSAPFVSV